MRPQDRGASPFCVSGVRDRPPPCSAVMHTRIERTRLLAVSAALFAVLASACHDATTAPIPPTSGNACSVSGTLALGVNQAARVDCSNGGTTVTVAGNGASYLVVPQFAISLVPNSPTTFRLTSSGAASTTIASNAPSPTLVPSFAAQVNGLRRPLTLQRGFDRKLRQRAASLVASGAWSSESAVAPPSRSVFAAASVPDVGSARSFRVLANLTGTAFSTVTARLAFSGANILVYVDTLAPTGGFTADQLQAFGTLFDQTLYPIDTAAFGGPSDVDQNGHVIMLMSPVVNSLTP